MAHDSERRRVAGRLHSAAIRVLRYAREADRESPLGPAQLSALSVLVYGGARNLRDLAETEQVSAPTMTRIVQALQRGGYVRLARSPEDARASIVRATPKGTAALERARTARLDLIESLLARHSAAEIAALGQALSRIS
ncbi:MAG: MarR family transcriptional regulator [Candidatus Cybelea sp.]